MSSGSHFELSKIHVNYSEGAVFINLRLKAVDLLATSIHMYIVRGGPTCVDEPSKDKKLGILESETLYYQDYQIRGFSTVLKVSC